MGRKRATLDDRIDLLKAKVYVLALKIDQQGGASSTSARRTLAGLRAALHVMEAARERGDKEYCKP